MTVWVDRHLHVRLLRWLNVNVGRADIALDAEADIAHWRAHDGSWRVIHRRGQETIEVTCRNHELESLIALQWGNDRR
jgi:hypothetical protein